MNLRLSSFGQHSALATLALPLLLSLAGCKHKPCNRGDLVVDTRPLPADWASIAAAPEGSAMCWTVDPNGYTNSRNYEVPASTTPEAVKKWETALTAKGWKKAAPTKADFEAALRPDQCMTEERYELAGAKLQVGVSSCAKGVPGWSSVHFTPAPKP